MAQLPKIIVRDRAYIPVSEVDVRAVKNEYTVKLYKEGNCARCEYKPDRHTTVCDTCDSYEGELNLWKMRDIRDTRYIGLPLGDKKNYNKRLGIDFADFRILDLRSEAPFDYKVKFTLNLRDYQEKMAEDFAKHMYGLIESPPRSGKTPSTLGMAIRTGTKILITACQHEFLQGFIDHIEGNEKDGVPKCTNLPELQEKYGKKLYGFPKKPEDLDNFQIFLVTYQTFMSKKGRKLLREICRRCGVVLVDEAHKAGATSFTSVLNDTFTKVRFGCTGTVKRKDCFVAGSEVVMHDKTLKSIEKIEVGDTVLSLNHTTNEIETKEVVETHIRKKQVGKRLIKITHEHGTFTCTEDEEIWSHTRNKYVKALDIGSDIILVNKSI